MEELLARIRLDFPTLAKLSGLSQGYLRQLSSGNRNAGPQTRSRLAKALRKHAARLIKEAERLEEDD